MTGIVLRAGAGICKFRLPAPGRTKVVYFIISHLGQDQASHLKSAFFWKKSWKLNIYLKRCANRCLPTKQKVLAPQHWTGTGTVYSIRKIHYYVHPLITCNIAPVLAKRPMVACIKKGSLFSFTNVSKNVTVITVIYQKHITNLRFFFCIKTTRGDELDVSSSNKQLIVLGSALRKCS
jgi:hypothetical protein